MLHLKNVEFQKGGGTSVFQWQIQKPNKNSKIKVLFSLTQQAICQLCEIFSSLLILVAQ